MRSMTWSTPTLQNGTELFFTQKLPCINSCQTDGAVFSIPVSWMYCGTYCVYFNLFWLKENYRASQDLKDEATTIPAWTL